MLSQMYIGLHVRYLQLYIEKVCEMPGHFEPQKPISRYYIFSRN